MTSKNTIQKTVTQEKWNNGKRLVEEVIESSNWDLNKVLSYKHLERVRGFICHLAMTFDILFPFLKGFHLTLASHLPKRDKQG